MLFFVSSLKSRISTLKPIELKIKSNKKLFFELL